MVPETQDLGRCCMEWRNEESDLGGVNQQVLACCDMEPAVAAERAGVRV